MSRSASRVGAAITRRGFLARSALAAGGMVLGTGLGAACSDGGENTRAGRGGGRTLRISNWPLYIDGRTVADFERTTGIETDYTEDINDNAEFLARISEPLRRGRSIDRDIVVLTDWTAARLIERGYVAPLLDGNFPNKANLVDDLKQVDFDPGRRYTVPWMSGMTGVGYNPERTGRELTSINDLFDPGFKGQVTMLTEMRDTLGLVMLGMGRDPATCTRADVQAAAARVKRARESGQIRKFTGNDYVEDLAAGNIAAAFAWSGDMHGLAADNPVLRWIAPQEGAILYSDNMMIPNTSDRRELAMAWMNFVYEPKHSARIVAGAPYLSPVKGTAAELAKLAPALASSPLVNPPEELRARLHTFRTLDDAEDTGYNRIFQDAIGA
ncbi:MAG TPA: spermidine/putrescine ABC transporter substrate-binding protein [Gemmatimonadales bacterium]|nr:spermidine/putrescine ABC transporter substrate-binding protein [Gemmatimonadales bacterium]